MANNTVLGYKRGILCESADNKVINNICRSEPKTAKFISGSRPRADILVNGTAARGARIAANLLVNDLLLKLNGAASADSGNRSGDPQFVDEARGDVRLKPGSPCRAAGIDPGVPLTDARGRPLAPPFSIGAYPLPPDAS